MVRKAGGTLERFADWDTVWTVGPWAFTLALATTFLWLAAGPLSVFSDTRKFVIPIGASPEGARPVHGKAFPIERPESAFARTPDLELARRTALILEHTMRQRHAPEDVIRAAREYERNQGIRARPILEWASENPSVGDALMLGTLTEDMLRPSEGPVGARVPITR
jgi:Low affinity iron permease